MKFTKMHGAGNDYVFVDGRDGERDWPALSIAMSDRHLGVGSDGVIVLQSADDADIRMSMFNADGSQGEMCGNGIRCFVRFAIDNGAVPADRSPITVETLAGVLEVAPGWDGDELTHASVSMGEPILEPAKVPVSAPGAGPVLDYPLTVGGCSFNLTFVSMGNPHAVAFIDEPVDEVPLHELGPLVENHPIFPNRVNFEIVNVVSETALTARVWERGSGLTRACGTGACAIAVAARLHGLTGDDAHPHPSLPPARGKGQKEWVTVALPGGELTVRWPGHGEVILNGPVAKVYEGTWPG